MKSFSPMPELMKSLNEGRKNIYTLGFYNFKNFITDLEARSLSEFWSNNDLVDFEFHDPICNRDVTTSSKPYLLFGDEGRSHRSYCINILAKPVDEFTHEIAFRAAILRNQLMRLPLYSTLTPECNWITQYRIVISNQKGTVVGKHRDFMEEFRKDPLGPHDYDPSKLQMTLFLTEASENNLNSGFYLELDGQKKYFSELGCCPGDLLVWRYGLFHGVDNLPTGTNGFQRIIFPTFFNKG